MGLVTSLFESSCTIQRPTIGQAVNRETTQDPPVTIARDVPCSWQEASGRQMTLYGQRSIAVDTSVYFDHDPGIEANDTIIATNWRTNETAWLLVQGKAQSSTHGRVWTVPALRIESPRPN